MKQQPLMIVLLAAMISFLSGCEVIGGIFKAGMGVGIFIVLLVVGIVIWLLSKMRRK